MTDLATKIKIMQAASDGKEIEYGYADQSENSTWSSIGKPQWDWVAWSYRIKQEPMEFWVNVYLDGLGQTYETKVSALEGARPSVQNTIKVREVTE